MRKLFLLLVFIAFTSTIRAQTLYGTTYAGGTNGKGTICKLDRSTGALTASYTFEAPDGYSAMYSYLTQAKNGKLYGMTLYGGSNGIGTIFSYNPNTAAYTKLVDLGSAIGSFPQSGLLQAADGKLYGMTRSGGKYDRGVIFSYDPATGVYAKLFDFDLANGSNPYGSLMQATDGKLYGMAAYGGSKDAGVIFSFNPATAVYTKLKDFDYTNGAYPRGSLIQGSNGKLYGMTYGGGTSGYGVMFSFNPTTKVYAKLTDFNSTIGTSPHGSLIQAKDGKLYGMTQRGGSSDIGVLFSYNLSTATYSKVVEFDYINGGNPFGHLIEAADGKLYGMTAYGSVFGYSTGGTIFSYNPAGNAFTRLMYFDETDTNVPQGSLMQATDGKLYGMTGAGGVGGYGVIFSYNLNMAAYTKLRDFGINGTGSNVKGNVVADASGKLYGVTYDGGDSARGVLFSYNPVSAVYTKLVNFDGNNGANPNGGLIWANDGKLYGMTTQSRLGYGTVYSYNPTTAIFTKLKDFDYNSGFFPNGNLVQAANGKLYGMTSQGGSNGYGVIFSFDPVTANYTKLLDFDGTNGKRPNGSLVQASDGKLYGMTANGGTVDRGVLFSYDPVTAAYKKLRDCDALNGLNPDGSLVQAVDGKLYGMTSQGGSKDSGVLFSYDPVTTVYKKILNFYDNKGSYPLGSLTQASDGKLYGMTTYGGVYNAGVTFSFDPVTSTFRKIQDFNGENGKNPRSTFFTEVSPVITIKINNVSIQEGNSGQQNLTFNVILSAASSKTVTVDCKTKDGTAIASSDYIAQRGTLTFAPGVKKQTISIPINGDVQVEGDEKFKVLLVNPVNATIADNTGVGTIWNDDNGFTETPAVKEFNISSHPIIVSPNPAKAYFTITLNKNILQTGATLQLCDLSGQVMLTKILQNSGTHKVYLPATLAKGMYIVLITSKDEEYSTKLIIE